MLNSDRPTTTELYRDLFNACNKYLWAELLNDSRGMLDGRSDMIHAHDAIIEHRYWICSHFRVYLGPVGGV